MTKKEKFFANRIGRKLFFLFYLLVLGGEILRSCFKTKDYCPRKGANHTKTRNKYFCFDLFFVNLECFAVKNSFKTVS